VFCVSSRSYVCKVLSPTDYCRPVGIAYDAAARHLYVGVVSDLGHVSVRIYSVTFPVNKAPPPSLIPAGDVDVHPPSSVAVSDVTTS
jgi:hypothetical protein